MHKKIAFVQIILFSVLICFNSCTEGEIIYYELGKEELADESDVDDKVRMLFNADISKFSTESTTQQPIDTGRYVSIYACNYVPGNVLVKYYSKQSGTLTPIGSPMYLVTGVYSIYAIGINKEGVAQPVLLESVCSNIQNNVDYIWWATYNVNVDKTP